MTPAVAAVSVLVAAYTGMRMPSAWSASLQSVSFRDGFHRRFLVGTVMNPIAETAGYPYWIYALLSFLILAGLLAVLISQAVSTHLPARRLLVFGFFLLPTGGYLFHEVGYFDQILYLLLFGALWMLGRGRWLPASLLLVLAMCVHEIAALTVLPLFFVACLRTLAPARAIVAAAPACVTGLLILTIEPTAPETSLALQRKLEAAHFPVRPDALEVFSRSQANSWKLYSRWDVFLYLLPLVVLIAIALLLFVRTGDRPPKLPAMSVLAALAPAMATLAGWDRERWAFLLIVNFFIVLWIWFGDYQLDVKSAQFGVAFGALLLTVCVPLTYFDGFSPRPLTGSGISEFYEHVTSGRFFDEPRL
ncbi:hypothetical protein [Embleya hyalina]|uniref:EpsG family protein n=1 Tax=Embleya hyalina TaxID=516124 RepID=A0A401YQF8_9ACTN|nr:hypothetical protein [Embleya hyalina]GCD96836.1 hypothetical protein EHYA_04523 [Embleya hyalina]